MSADPAEQSPPAVAIGASWGENTFAWLTAGGRAPASPGVPTSGPRLRLDERGVRVDDTRDPAVLPSEPPPRRRS